MSYKIEFRRPAERELERLTKRDPATAKRIADALDRLAEDPRPPGVKALKGNARILRIRVGDYRVVYTVQDQLLVVLVVAIGHRREVYERLGLL